MRRHILIALSLANLWYLRVWSELLTYSRADTYLMVHPPRPVDYAAVMLNVLIAAAIFLCLQMAVERIARPWLTRLAIMAFVASLLVPLNALREVLANQFPEYLKSPLLDHIGVKGVLAIA